MEEKLNVEIEVQGDSLECQEEILYEKSLLTRVLSSELIDERVNKIKMVKNHIYFYCTINQDSCLLLILTILNLLTTFYKIRHEDFRDEKKLYDIIHLHINSLGGEVHSSLSLYDYLLGIQSTKKNKCRLYTYAEGIVASGATLLYLAGEKRFITRNSFIMIHLLSSLAFGKHNELNNVIKLNNLIMNKIYDIYMNFMNINVKKLKKLLLKDVYLDYKECLEKYNLSTNLWGLDEC